VRPSPYTLSVHTMYIQCTAVPYWRLCACPTYERYNRVLRGLSTKTLKDVPAATS